MTDPTTHGDSQEPGNYEIPAPGGNRPPRRYNRPPKKQQSGTGKILAIVGVLAILGIGAFSVLVGVGSAISGGVGSGHYREATEEKGTSGKKVVIIPIHGIISSGSGIFGGFAGVDDIRAKLKMAGKDTAVTAIILDINSPGGEVTATDELHHEVQNLRKNGIKVITCMRSVAASGGYYMAAGTDYIIANRLTMTGSIGVVIGGMNYNKLMEKLGVESNTFKSGRMKDMGSPSRHTLDDIARLRVDLTKQKNEVQRGTSTSEIKQAELSRIKDALASLDQEESIVKQEKQLIQSMVNECFLEFAQIVADGRKLPLESVKKAPIGDARILSGSEALRLKLVDELGYMEDAIAHARTDGNHTIVKYDPVPTIFDAFSGRAQGPALLKEVVPAHLRIIKKGRLYYMNPSVF